MNPSYQPYEQSPETPHSNVENGAVVDATNLNRRLQSEKNSQIAELPGTHLPASPAQKDNSLPLDPPPIQGNDDNSQIQIDGIDLPQEATDEDLIESEWVTRARAIVDKTREDPHNQNKEMNKMKAAYIKKRYNKDVKVEEE